MEHIITRIHDLLKETDNLVCVKLFSVFSVDLLYQYFRHSIFVRFFATALRLLTVPYGLRSTNQEPNP